MNDLPFFPLIDKTDHDIFMHKDVHFGGSFLVMIDYYKNQGKGIQSEFDLDRIEELYHFEEQSHQNLSDLLLTEEEKELVKTAKDKYFSLRELYQIPSASLPQKIADLILTEDPEATKEIQALCKLGDPAIPLLLDLLKQDEFFDPLYPGYGLAPAHAATCLGKMRATQAIGPLFEALSKAEFFTEEAILAALFHIGAPAKLFLLNILQKKPINRDNENAAIALLSFKDDPMIVERCFELLQDPALFSHPALFTYLLLVCDSLTEPLQRAQLKKLSEHPNLPSDLKEELHFLNQWKS
jgi:HEAT repeat protein